MLKDTSIYVLHMRSDICLRILWNWCLHSSTQITRIMLRLEHLHVHMILSTWINRKKRHLFLFSRKVDSNWQSKKSKTMSRYVCLLQCSEYVKPKWKISKKRKDNDSGFTRNSRESLLNKSENVLTPRRFNENWILHTYCIPFYYLHAYQMCFVVMVLWKYKIYFFRSCD